MQIQCMPILKVIFVLSTIVAVTDCCSSRILLLREHTLQIEEHVVQLVNQMELQQQLSDDGQPIRNPGMKLFSDTGQIIQMETEHSLDSKLATIVTTERDVSTELWSADDDEETKTTTTVIPTTTTKPTTSTTTPTITTTAKATAMPTTDVAASTTTTTAVTTTDLAMTSTITMATGEPPPDENESTTQQTEQQLASEASTLNILDLNVATSPTTKSSITSTTTLTASSTTIAKAQTPNSSEDISYNLPCMDVAYATAFCLNGGNCYTWGKTNFYYCVCADGYVGERCDSKTEDGVYVPLHPGTIEPTLKTAHIVFSFPMLILLSTIYVGFGAAFMFRNVLAQRRKQQQLHLHKQRFFVSC